MSFERFALADFPRLLMGLKAAFRMRQRASVDALIRVHPPYPSAAIRFHST
jgi:hypothetical protein